MWGKKFTHYLYVIEVLIVLMATTCKTVEEPEEKPEIPQEEKPEIPQEEVVREPFQTKWDNTSWIVPDQDWDFTATDIGYWGFHLAADGQLFLLNVKNVAGYRWKAYDNILEFELLGDSGTNLLNGIFQVFESEPKQPDKIRIELIPVNPYHNDRHLVLEKAVTQVDMVENHWKPLYFPGGNNVIWPFHREVYFVILPDGSGGYGINGYSGINRFKGKIRFHDGILSTGPLFSTLKTGPTMAFEHLYLNHLKNTNRYVQVKRDLFMYDKTVPTAIFSTQLFD